MIRSRVLTWCLSSGLLVLPGCAAERSDGGASVRTTLDSTLQEHGRMAIAGDVEGILRQYTSDAIVRINHAEPLVGVPALRASLKAAFAGMRLSSLTYQTEGLAVYGDSAWHINTFRVAGTVAGTTVADSGSGFVLWVRDSAGTWRIKHDILNSRVPLPTPTPR